MSTPSFQDFSNELFRLFDAGQYETALDQIALHAADYPEDAYDLDYYRLCLITLSRGVDAALAYFRAYVESGRWFSPELLTWEPDLKSLVGHPEFQRLTAICVERCAAAQANGTPDRITLPPKRAEATPAPLLLQMHGNWHHPRQEVDFWRPLTAQGWLVALLQSSQVGAPDRYVWNDLDQGAREVAHHYAELTAAQAGDRGQTVLAGFSAGGGLAITAAVRGTVPVRGFVTIAAALHPGELRPIIDAARPQGLRGYLIVGGRDEHAMRVAQEVQGLMQEHGLACALEVHPDLGHAYPPNFEQSLVKALHFILDPTGTPRSPKTDTQSP